MRLDAPRSWPACWLRSRSRVRPPRPRRRLSPRVETLEARTVPATFTVSNTSDTAVGSLRQAILDANANAGADVIDFNIAGSGVHTIQPQSALPAITDPVFIDGYTQPGASPNTLTSGATDAVLLIELDGSSAGSAHGLSLQSTAIVIRGLVINRFELSGLSLFTASGSAIVGNFIGTDPTGMLARPNGAVHHGISSVSSDNLIIGGAAPGDRNLISANGGGVTIGNGSNNLIQGNLLGTNAVGAPVLGNTYGVNFLNFSADNLVGGTNPGEGNVIAGNTLFGVLLNNFAGVTVNNAVLGNAIFANGGDGNLGIDIVPVGVTNNDAGDADDGVNHLQNSPEAIRARINGAGNLIITYAVNSASEESDYPLRIEFFEADSASSGEGRSFLGSDTYTAAIGSVSINLGPAAALGVALGDPIVLTATDAGDNTSEFSAVARTVDLVVTNTDDSGPGSLRQAILDANADPGSNTIWFNIPGGGVQTIQPGSSLPAITGPVNLDGYSQPGASPNTLAVGNNAVLLIELDGSMTEGATGLNLQAGNSNLRGLVINRWGQAGIRIDTQTNVVIQGNFIGTSADGNTALGNGTGVLDIAGLFDVIGGPAPADRNLISGNVNDGVRIIGSGTGSRVENNYIGTNAAGTGSLGNGVTGVTAELGTSGTIIVGNVLSGNTQGIFLGEVSTTVATNFIGVAADGVTPLPNTQEGILIGFGNNIAIGGPGGMGNTIAYNGAAGIAVTATGPVAIRGNSFTSNGGLAIDLGNDGPTINDPRDSDTGPNRLQNFPEVLEARINGAGRLLVTYAVDTTTANSTFPLSVDFYEADSFPEGEGRVFLDSDTYVTESSVRTYDLGPAAALGVAVGDPIVLTVTDDLGNTSEFSPAVAVTSSDLVVTTTSDSGLGSLRQAILAANADPGPNVIRFAIPGTGVQTIAVSSALPPLTDSVVIDGYTQPGAAANTLAVGNDATLLIQLDGSFAGPASGLELQVPFIEIRGLIITGFSDFGVLINGSTDAVVAGNFIGADASGVSAVANGVGVGIVSGMFNDIGGAAPADRNVISGNSAQGVWLLGGSVSSNTVQGNYIGTTAAGTAALPNGNDGVEINDAPGNFVGGDLLGEGNVISGNTGHGVEIVFAGASGNTIQGNFIGLNATGTSTLPNSDDGVNVNDAPNNLIGGTLPGASNVISGNSNDGVDINGAAGPSAIGNVLQGNLIGTLPGGPLPAGNGGAGVLVRNNAIATTIGGTLGSAANVIAHNAVGVKVVGPGTAGATVLGNLILANAGLGIDLGASGVTPNDLGDADTGPNGLQNFPVLRSASGTTVTGFLESTPSTSFRLEFFLNAPTDPARHGATILGSATVNTNAAGRADFIATVTDIPGGVVVTATATNLATGATSEFSAGPPASVQVTAGDSQSATVATDFANNLSVTVLDGFGEALPGVPVTFTAPGLSPSGRFSGSTSATVATDAMGLAVAPTFTATSLSGSYQVTATAGVASATFDLTNVAGPATTIFVNAGSPQSATVNTAFATALQALVVDAFGNAVSGVSVTFTAPGSAASGRFGASTTAMATTDAAGLATASTFTATTTSGSYQVTASSGILTPVTFDLTNLAGTPASLAVVAGTPQTATANTAFATPFRVRVLDAFDNPVAGASVMFTAPANGASGRFAGLATVVVVTDATGIADSGAFTANTVAGSYAVTASVAGVPNATFALTNAPGLPANVTATTGTPQTTTVNTAFATALQVRVTDAFSNPVPGVSVTFTALGATASARFGGSTTAVIATDAAGLATAPTLTSNTVSGAHQVSAAVAGLTAATFSLTNRAGPVATLAATAGTPQTAVVGSAFPTALQVLATDAFGNPVPDTAVTFAAPSSGATGSFAGSATVTTSATGTAAAPTLTAGTVAGSFTVTASVGGSGASATFSLTNRPDVPALLTVTSGDAQSATVATAFATNLAVRLTDRFGNAVPDTIVTFSAPTSGAGGTFGGSAQVTTDANGAAQAPALTANTVAGTFTASASANGVAGATFSLTNLADVPSTLEATGGDGQEATVGTTFAAALAVRVADRFGNPVSGVSVTFSAPTAGAGATFAGSASAVVTTDTDGTASSPIPTANTVTGAYSATATVAGVPSVTFGLSNEPANGTSLSVVSGDGQSATVATAFGARLRVVLRDDFDNPVGGVAVTFTAPTSGPGASFAGTATSVVITGDDGIAESPPLTASTQAGAFNVSATSAGSMPTRFDLVATADVPAQVAAVGGGQTARVGTPFAAPLQALVTDRFGNATPGVAVTFVTTAGSFASGVTATATTDAAGLATAPTLTAPTLVGPFTATATVADVDTPATFLLATLTEAAASVSADVGSGQSAVVGSTFGQAPTVVVRDAFGNPVPGVVVTFTAPLTGPTATLGGAATFTAVTGADGRATAPVPAAGIVAGDYALFASVDGVPLPARFDLRNVAGVPTALLRVLGAGQSATVATAFATPLAVVATDAFGNPVPGVLVTFTVPPTGAAFAGPTTVLTDLTGLATSPPLVAGTLAGAYVAQAAILGTPAAIFALTNDPAPAATLAVTGLPGSIVAGNSVTFTITALDPFGNRDVNYRGTVQFTTSDVQADLPTAFAFTADDQGARRFEATLRTADVQSLRAADLAVPSVAGEDRLAVVAASAVRLALTGPLLPLGRATDDQNIALFSLAGAPFAVRLTAFDAFDNVATSYRGTVSLTSTDRLAVLPGPFVFRPEDAGAVTFPGLILGTAGTQTLTATDTSDGRLTVALELATRPVLNIRGPDAIPVFQPYTLTLETSPLGNNTIRSWTIDWADGTVETLPGNPSTATHVYTDAPNGYFIRATAVDDFGTLVDLQPVQVNVLVVGVQPGNADSAEVPPGGTLTVTVDGRVTATVLRSPLAREVLTVFIAVYDDDPVNVRGDDTIDPIGGRTIIPDPAGSGFLVARQAYDVRVSGSELGDTIIATLALPTDASPAAVLRYFDPVQNAFLPVVGSRLLPNSFVLDRAAGTITVVLDETSAPRLSELTGTIFTIFDVPPALPAPVVNPASVVQVLVLTQFPVPKEEKKDSDDALAALLAVDEKPEATRQVGALAPSKAALTSASALSGGGGGAPPAEASASLQLLRDLGERLRGVLEWLRGWEGLFSGQPAAEGRPAEPLPSKDGAPTPPMRTPEMSLEGTRPSADEEALVRVSALAADVIAADGLAEGIGYPTMEQVALTALAMAGLSVPEPFWSRRRRSEATVSGGGVPWL